MARRRKSDTLKVTFGKLDLRDAIEYIPTKEGYREETILQLMLLCAEIEGEARYLEDGHAWDEFTERYIDEGSFGCNFG